ncbi:hypothetical protein ABK040_010314 [Willaertia magna]
MSLSKQTNCALHRFMKLIGKRSINQKKVFNSILFPHKYALNQSRSFSTNIFNLQEETTKEEEKKEEGTEQKTTTEKKTGATGGEKRKREGKYYKPGDPGPFVINAFPRRKVNYEGYYGTAVVLPIISIILLKWLYDQYKEFGFSFENIKARLEGISAPFLNPTGIKLLPDLPEGVPVKPILVLGVEDVLIHTSYTPRAGWKTQKRPGFDQFLQSISNLYEVVFFSDNFMMTIDGVLQKLDPNMVAHRLYRDATSFEGGKNIKDLTVLNRPLDKTLMIEAREEACARQPENCLRIPPWKGDTNDRFLIDVIPYLEFLAAKGSKFDLRTVLQEYGNRERNGVDIIKEFNQNLDKRRKGQQPTKPGTQQAPSGGSSWWKLR